nr:MAG TPA: hypothetical protein [Bacteriophage sp.]
MHEPFCLMRKIIGYDDDEWRTHLRNGRSIL